MSVRVAPGEREADERAWEVVRAAYATREPVAWPRRHVRAARRRGPWSPPLSSRLW